LKYLDYEINHYLPELRGEVVDVLGQLLGDDEATNDAFFGWKYEQNPHADELLGIVALHEGKVVGFRGYGSARWHTGTGRTMQVLVPGDTCVDVNHRQKGLSVAMGKLAMTDYAATYKLFLNLSCTRNSLPGYLRLGFAPLADKVHLSRYGLLSLVQYVLSSKKQLPVSAARIRYGQFGDVKVSDAPMPGQMASIVERQNHDTDKIHLCQQEDFFRWRFADPARKFVFYYRTAGDDDVAYLVMAVTPSNRRGYVIDHADTDGESSGRLFEFVIARHDFSVLSVFDHSVSAPLKTTLQRLGFHAGGMMGAMEKKLRGNLPLLVRPVRAEPNEDDWLINGLDVRATGNWLIKGVCSDA
jgi:hypothetical protein